MEHHAEVEANIQALTNAVAALAIQACFQARKSPRQLDKGKYPYFYLVSPIPN